MSAESAGLQHLPQSPSNGKQKKEESFTPTFAQATSKGKNVILKLVHPTEGKVYMECYAENVMNPNTKKLDTIRLLKGVYSIWLSDQTTVTENYAKRNRKKLVFDSFVDGNGHTQSTCTVPASDTTTIDAIRHLPSNMGNDVTERGHISFLFYEYNPAKQAEDSMKQEMLMVEAMQKAFAVEPTVMKKHAWYLGVNPVDEMGQVKDDDFLRKDYALRAKQNPKLFLDTLDSPLVTISYLVKKAINDAKIDLGREVNTACWANGGFICKLPSNKKAADFLIEFAMLPTEEGKLFKEHLEKTV